MKYNHKIRFIDGSVIDVNGVEQMGYDIMNPKNLAVDGTMTYNSPDMKVSMRPKYIIYIISKEVGE